MKKTFIPHEVTLQNFAWSRKEGSIKNFGIERVNVAVAFRFT